MLSQEHPVSVNIKQAYHLLRSPLEHAVAANMAAAVPHSFSFSLKGDTGMMSVDHMAEEYAIFTFPSPKTGCFSLASNAAKTDPGAFRYIRLTANGKTLLDIDFREIRSVDELETYFECYYFPDLDCGREGILTPIRQFWGLNPRGHLYCTRECTGRIPLNDCEPICLLTLRQAPIGDFEADVGFEQCWRRYGIIFGCESRKLPYYTTLNSWEPIGVQGGFAFVGAHDGSCCMRGALLSSEEKSAHHAHYFTPAFYTSGSSEALISRFRSTEQVSLPYHTLTYHFSTGMTYHFPDRSIRAQAGSVIYLPPCTPCRLEGDADRIMRVEFDCNGNADFSPAVCIPEQPESVRLLFEDLIRISYSVSAGTKYRMLSVFYRIMAELSHPLLDTAVAVRRATRYIDTHFTRPNLSVREIAKAVDVSESHLYQLFRKSGALSPKEYILKCRIDYACALLKMQYYKVYEIAEKCGFTDEKYFSTVFKKKMGVSPGKYMAQKTERPES